MFRVVLFLALFYFSVGQEFPANICDLPKEIGKCRKYVDKYFYNASGNVCEIFGWGGCGGNANKFDTLYECNSSCKNVTSKKEFRSAIKSSILPKTEVLKGTVLDVNQVETDIIDFESAFGNWSSQGVKIVNVSDTIENAAGIKEKAGELVLVPTVSLGGDTDSELSKSFNIAADSRLEIDFSLYVSGYNSTLVGGLFQKYNPSFEVLMEDEASKKRATALDLNRLHVSDGAWKKLRYTITNEAEKTLKIIFLLSSGIGSGNVIALDDVEIRWIPMLETEADTLHANILFRNVSIEFTAPDNDATTAGHELNNGGENSTEIITTESTTTQGLFGELSVETINNAQSTNNTIIETPENTNETSTNNSTLSSTKAPLVSNNTGNNETTENPTTYTDNPNIFGPFNTTTKVNSDNETSTEKTEVTGFNKTETTTSTNMVSPENNSTTSNTSNIVFPENTTNNTTNIVFPENNNNTENTSQPTQPITVSNPEEVNQNQTTKENTSQTEATTVKTPENVTNLINTTNTTNTSDTETELTTLNTTIFPTLITNITASNSSAIKADPDTDSISSYGYTAEVVLICLVVIFGLLFLLMVVKYYRLRTTIGDYQIQQGARQTYDNPAFNGFGMQDSYRSR